MKYQHRELASGGWRKLSFFEQMANIGSEVERGIKWKNKNNDLYSQKAIERAFELLTLTIASQQKQKKLKELTRLREMLVDYFFGQNQYSSTSKLWQKYFRAFNYAAMKLRAKESSDQPAQP
jgi:hypothetical protein